MTNPLLQKYEEIHNPKKPEPPKPRYNNLNYKEQNLIRMLKELITDIENGKAFYDKHETQPNWKRIDTEPFWGDVFGRGKASIDPHAYMRYDRGDMLNIKVFRRYD
jgi:hypothetical protein